MKKYLVTGGAGFIGSHIVDRLIKDGHEVIVVDNFCSGKEENLNSKAEVFNLDISDPANKEKITSLMSDCVGVFHLAALARVQPSIEDPVGFNKANVDGTLNILICAKKCWRQKGCLQRKLFCLRRCYYFPNSRRPSDRPFKSLWFTKINRRTVLQSFPSLLWVRNC